MNARARALGVLPAAVCVGAIAALLAAQPGMPALPSYALYYSFEIPLALPAITLGDEGARKTYAGTLRGSLGGLPLRAASFSYGTGASAGAGGGTFSLATAAGEVRDGRILMTTDGARTTLLFFGIYLGTRLEFSITSDSQQVGGTGVTAAGLARTGFASHDDYMAAVRQSVASLPAETRDQIISQADANPRLVRDYQQRPSSR